MLGSVLLSSYYTTVAQETFPVPQTSTMNNQRFLSNSCGEDAYWHYDSQSATLTITGSGRMDDYANYAPPWIAYRPYIQRVVVEEGITTIGWSAFYGCSALTEVYLPNTVTHLEYGAFAYCTSLEDIYLPESLLCIGVASFTGSSSLTSITVPASTTAIEDSAFLDCTGLQSISLPLSLNYVGSIAFNNCNSLTTVYYQGYSSNKAKINLKSYYNSKLTNARWVYGTYTEKEAPIPPVIEPEPEIPNWAKPYTDFVADFIMTDISASNYNESATRGLIAQSLYNMLGNGTLPEVVPSFHDVTEYATPVAWCFEQGLMSGISETEFGSNSNVTREQFALILQKSGEISGKISVESDSSLLSSYHDSTTISTWATEGMAWAVANGLISGTEGGLLQPTGYITRAEVAVMLYKWSQL